MSRQVLEIEAILEQLIEEHRKLLAHVDAHQAAIKRLDLRAMDQAAKLQEAARLRITGMENRRRALVAVIAKSQRIVGDMNISQLAKAFPDRAATLTKQRDALKALATAIQSRVHVAGRVAGALLGHLNTVVRIIASTVKEAGVYTKHGVPQVKSRIGSIEAVG